MKVRNSQGLQLGGLPVLVTISTRTPIGLNVKEEGKKHPHDARKQSGKVIITKYALSFLHSPCSLILSYPQEEEHASHSILLQSFISKRGEKQSLKVKSLHFTKSRCQVLSVLQICSSPSILYGLFCVSGKVKLGKHL